MTNFEWLRGHLLEAVQVSPVGDKRESLQSLRQSEWSAPFEKAMRNRLLMGRFRYGAFNDPAKDQYDRMSSVRRRLRLFEDSGNLECLVDAAALLMLEFEETDHPLAHFRATDDGEHAEKK